MPRRKISKVPNENMVVFITAPKIFGDNHIYKAYIKKLSSPSKDGQRLMTLDVEAPITLTDLSNGKNFK